MGFGKSLDRMAGRAIKRMDAKINGAPAQATSEKPAQEAKSPTRAALSGLSQRTTPASLQHAIGPRSTKALNSVSKGLLQGVEKLALPALNRSWDMATATPATVRDGKDLHAVIEKLLESTPFASRYPADEGRARVGRAFVHAYDALALFQKAVGKVEKFSQPLSPYAQAVNSNSGSNKRVDAWRKDKRVADSFTSLEMSEAGGEEWDGKTPDGKDFDPDFPDALIEKGVAAEEPPGDPQQYYSAKLAAAQAASRETKASESDIGANDSLDIRLSLGDRQASATPSSGATRLTPPSHPFSTPKKTSALETPSASEVASTSAGEDLYSLSSAGRNSPRGAPKAVAPSLINTKAYSDVSDDDETTPLRR